LANFFIDQLSSLAKQKKVFSARALAAITAFDWPGNIRELENRIKRSVIMSEDRTIEPADLELSPDSAELVNLDIRAARIRAERHVILLALRQSNGVISNAAKLLGVSRPTLYGLLQEHQIEAAPELRTDQDAAEREKIRT
jgi:two-component system NtrC family response regulator